MLKTYPIVSCQTVWDRTLSLELSDECGVPVSEETGLIRIGGVPETVQVAKALIGDKPDIHSVVMGLDAKLQITFLEIVSKGSPTSSPLAPVQVYRSAVLHNCGAIAIAVNHPSGSVLPSETDLLAFDVLGKAGKSLNIRLVDAIVVSHDDRYYSAKDKGEITW